MEKMKYDMAGGATMLGADARDCSTEAEAQGDWDCLRDGEYAFRQGAEAGDVRLRCPAKAIEIINTDAEGRVVLGGRGCTNARQLDVRS